VSASVHSPERITLPLRTWQPASTV
jgi:hypothetical protein